MTDSIGDVVKLIAPVATVVSSVSGMFQKTPKAPDIKIPAAAPTPLMPTPDDATAQAAAMKTIAMRAAQHGRQSTNLYDKNDTLGG